jgi:hypothetical protein
VTFTLEQMLCGRAAFGLTTASPVQRAICRALDGLPLGELAGVDDVVAAFGGVAALAMLPLGARPAEAHILSGIRTGKSLLAAALAVHNSQTCDLSKLGPGEVPRVSVLSLTLDLSHVVFGHLVGHLRERPALRALMIGEPTADAVMLRHPSGRAVEVKCVAGARAGASLVARWSAGVVFDEAPRMIGADDGVVNYADSRAAVLGRLLPGAMAIAIGSPWAPFGPVYEIVQERFGRPGRDVVVVRAPAPAMNPVYWTPERVAELAERDPAIHRTDVLGEFADAESSLLASDDVDRAVRPGPLELRPVAGGLYFAAMDPGTRANAWTLAIAHAEEVLGPPVLEGARSRTARFVVDLVRQWRPSKGEPLSPAVVLAEVATACRSYGVRAVTSDGWSADAIRDIAHPLGLEVQIENPTAHSNLELYENLRTRVVQGLVELPPVPELRADLLRVRKRVTQVGLSIVLPRTSDGRHADYAPSVAKAIDRAASAGVFSGPGASSSTSGHRDGAQFGGGLASSSSSPTSRLEVRPDGNGGVMVGRASPRGRGLGGF